MRFGCGFFASSSNHTLAVRNVDSFKGSALKLGRVIVIVVLDLLLRDVRGIFLDLVYKLVGKYLEAGKRESLLEPRALFQSKGLGRLRHGEQVGISPGKFALARCPLVCENSIS